jgi:hypothetical protein
MLRFRALALVFLLPITLGACTDASQDEAIDLATRAEQVRELTFDHEVPVERISREEYAKRAQARADAYDEADLAELAATYGRLGFFDPSLDLRQTLGARDWVGGEYSPEDERITLVGDVPAQSLVHEFVHGLQDQHFDLTKLDETHTSDEQLARRAAVEGDASLAQLRFQIEAQYDHHLDDVDWDRTFRYAESDSRRFLVDSSSPAFFAAYPAFAYTYGLSYCGHVLTGATRESPWPKERFPYAWSREDALFGSKIPVSTAQILTFDAIGAGAAVGLAEVPPSVTTLEAIDWDSLGAWYTYLLLAPVAADVGIGGPVQFAEGWAGDRALFVRAKADGRIGVVWAGAFRDASTAKPVEAALRALHGFTASDAEPRLGTADDGETVWLERADAHVVLVKNVDAADAGALAAAALEATAAAAPLRVYPPLDVRLRPLQPKLHPAPGP